MSLGNAKGVPVLQFFTDPARGILSDAALKATERNFSRGAFFYNKRGGFGYRTFYSSFRKVDADDVVTKTINNVERFIHNILKFAIFFAALAIYALGAKTGLIVAGSIALSSFLVIKVLNKKLSEVKDEWAKVYSWNLKHFRSKVGAFFTGVPVMTYKLVNKLY